MTNDTDTLTEQITDHASRTLREKLDEANRDDLGTTRGGIRDPTNAITDDRGNTKRRSRGVSDRKARKALDRLEDDVIESQGPRPNEQDGDDAGDVPDEIAHVADGEGW